MAIYAMVDGRRLEHRTGWVDAESGVMLPKAGCSYTRDDTDPTCGQVCDEPKEASTVCASELHIRHISDDDEGPFLQGLVECDHVVNGGSSGLQVLHESVCRLCNGTGWRPVPVVAAVDLPV